MRWLQYIFFHAFFVACCAAALCFQTVHLLQANGSATLYGLVFSSTLCSYNVHLLISRICSANERITLSGVLHRYGGTCVMIVLSGLLSLYCMMQLPQWYWVLPAAAATLLYSLPLLPWRFCVWLRRFGFAKTLLLALTWTYVTAWLPVAHWAGSSGDVVWLLVLRFLFMLQICLLFDLRDTRVDKVRGLHSLATDLRHSSVELVFFCSGILYVGAVYYWWLYCCGGQPVLLATVLGIMALCTALCYGWSQQQRGYLFYYFIVDGLMFLSALLTTLASI